MKCIKIAGFCSALFIVLAGCINSANKEKKHYNLRVVIDTASNFYLDSVAIDKPFQPDSNTGRSRSEYDPAYHGMSYRFDSVETGELLISLQSALDKQFDHQIVLKSDTTIYFNKKDLPSFITGNPDNLVFENMSPGDRIFIGYESYGCFHHYADKIIINRYADDYLIDFYSTKPRSPDNKATRFSKRLRRDFKDSLSVFQASIADFIREKQPGLCTTKQFFLIQKNDTIYRIKDGSCSRTIRYAAILKPIKREWFEAFHAQ